MATRNYEVRTKFIGDDRMSAQVKAIQKRFQSLGGVATQSMRKAGKQASYFGSIFKSMIAFSVMSRGISAVERGVAGVIGEFISLDGAITEAAAKFGDGFARNTKVWEDLRRKAREVGGQTEFTAAQGADALKFMAMAGFEAEEAMSSLKIMTNLASAANMELGRSADIATDAMGAFNLRSEDPKKAAKNLEMVADVITTTVNNANVTMEDWFQTMKQGGPVLKAAGQDVKTFSLLVGAFGDGGIKASRAGTTMKNMMLRLVAPPKAAADALKQYNVQATKAGDIRSLLDTLVDMEKALNKMNPEKRMKFLSDVFGRYAGPGMMKLFNEGISGLDKLRGKLNDATGATKRVSEMQRQSLENRLKILKSGLLEKGMQVFEGVFGTDFETSLIHMIKAVRDFDPKPLIDSLRAIKDALKAVGEFLYKHREELKMLLKAYVGLKAIGKSAAIIGGAWASIKLAIGPIVLAVAEALGVGAAAAGGLVVAIIALVAAIIYLCTHTEELRMMWLAALLSIKGGTNNTVNFVADAFGGLASSLKTLFLNIEISIKSSFLNLQIMGIKAVAAFKKIFAGAREAAAIDLVAKAQIASAAKGANIPSQREKFIAEQLTGLGARESVRQYYSNLADLGLQSAIDNTIFKKPAQKTSEAPNLARLEAQRQQSIDINLTNEFINPESGAERIRNVARVDLSGRGKPKVNINRAGRN